MRCAWEIETWATMCCACLPSNRGDDEKVFADSADLCVCRIAAVSRRGFESPEQRSASAFPGRSKRPSELQRRDQLDCGNAEDQTQRQTAAGAGPAIAPCWRAEDWTGLSRCGFYLS